MIQIKISGKLTDRSPIYICHYFKCKWTNRYYKTNIFGLVLKKHMQTSGLQETNCEGYGKGGGSGDGVAG